MNKTRDLLERVGERFTFPDDMFERLESRRDRKRRNQRIAAGVVGIAIFVAAVWIVTSVGSSDSTTTPANPPTTVDPSEKTAEEVAMGFVEAFGDFDADRAIAYLADGADIVPMMDAGGRRDVEGTLEEFRLLISLAEAEGYKQTLASCEELESSAPGGPAAPGTQVLCWFDLDSFGSDEIGLGPYSGNYFLLTVRDGEIVQASQYWNIAEFSPEMWEPLHTWVTINYPEDASVMYVWTPEQVWNAERLTEESIRLWERHIREYVEEAKQGST